MKKMLLVGLMSASVLALPATAGAAAEPPVDPNDSIACTLEKLGVLHSPVGSFCTEENPWD